MPRQNRPIDANRSTEPRSRKPRASRRSALPIGSRRYQKTTYSPPPVLIRRDVSGMAVRETRKGNHRKRLDIALGEPGAEMRLPSIPTVHFGWRLLSAIAVLGLAGLLYYLWTAPMFRVQAAAVKGSMRVSPGDINMVLGVDDQPVFTLNPNQMRSNLEKAFPEMSAITIEVSLPATVTVTVKERQPVLLWKQPGDINLWVDADGVVFPPRGDIGPLLTVEGELITTTVTGGPSQGSQRLDPGLVSALLELGKQAPEGVTMVVDKEHGLGWKDPRGWQAYFGMDIQNMDLKLKEYQAIVDKLMGDGVTPTLISVEYTHAPYYRLEQ